MSEDDVRHDPDRNRFEIYAGGTLDGRIAYELDGKTFAFTHTRVFPQFEGHGVGTSLVLESLKQVRELGGEVIPVCSFTLKVIRDHPEFVELVPAAARPRFGLV